MRVLFIGSVYFSKVTLEKLIDLKANIVGIITKEKSDFNSDFENLKPLAEKYRIPYLYANDLNHSNNLIWIKEKKPDIIFCFGWSSLIKKEILELPPLGVLGFHPSLLPANRGRHPLIWAKVLGLAKTGSTFFFMDEGADSGDLLNQREFPIELEDDAGTLYQKMIDLALLQIEDFLPQLQSGHYIRIKQVGISNIWRKRDSSDGLIDFRMRSIDICNLVRALAKPYDGAHCNFQSKEIKIFGVELGDQVSPYLEPGKVVFVDHLGIVVKTGDGSVILTKHEFDPIPIVGQYIK